MDAEKEIARIIEALRNGDRGAADDHAKDLVAWLDDNAGALAEYPEAWADLLVAADIGHLEYCPQVQRLLDLLDDPDAVTVEICPDCRNCYHQGYVDDPSPRWDAVKAVGWQRQWAFVYEKRRDEFSMVHCASCGIRAAGPRYIWRVDPVLGSAADPGMRGYSDEGDGFFSRVGERGVVFVLGVFAPSEDPEIEGDELRVVVGGHSRPTRAEAMMSLAEQLREYAGMIEARAGAEPAQAEVVQLPCGHSSSMLETHPSGIVECADCGWYSDAEIQTGGE